MEGPPAEVGPTERPLEQNAREPEMTDGNDVNDTTDTRTSSSDKAFQGLSTVSAPPQFSFAAKFVEGKSKNKMPGPGSYMNKTDFSSRHRTVPSFGFGTNTRQTRQSHQQDARPRVLRCKAGTSRVQPTRCRCQDFMYTQTGGTASKTKSSRAWLLQSTRSFRTWKAYHHTASQRKFGWDFAQYRSRSWRL